MWKPCFGLLVVWFLFVIVQSEDNGTETGDPKETLTSPKAASTTADPPTSPEAAATTADSPTDKRLDELLLNFPREFLFTAIRRPTKCQVCRVLTTEIQVELNKTKDAKATYYTTGRFDEGGAKKKIEYKNSEMRIQDIIERVCVNTYTYRPFHGPEFPYLKGVKSMFRASLERNADKKKYTRETAPSDLFIEDPTKELRRMFDKCNRMVEDYEDDIMDWYMNKQEVDIVDFLCVQRVLVSDRQWCLHASTEVPENMEQPVLLTETEKRIHYPIYFRKVEL